MEKWSFNIKKKLEILKYAKFYLNNDLTSKKLIEIFLFIFKINLITDLSYFLFYLFSEKKI